jgi:hypothetical protein
MVMVVTAGSLARLYTFGRDHDRRLVPDALTRRSSQPSKPSPFTNTILARHLLASAGDGA